MGWLVCLFTEGTYDLRLSVLVQIILFVRIMGRKVQNNIITMYVGLMTDKSRDIVLPCMGKLYLVEQVEFIGIVAFITIKSTN